MPAAIWSGTHRQSLAGRGMMPRHAILALLAALFLLFGAASRRLEAGVVTAPMLAVLMGLLAGPLVAGAVVLPLDSDVVTLIGEVALTLVLFTDASSVALRRLRAEWGVAARLLGIGLPLTALAGIAAGYATMPELGLIPLAVIALILA